ncbi:serine/threonine-protein kinase [Actinoplanes utahensis]|uniref:non-specific serine/threonine protein kinase n=1 Tax=Actinoplanes utahensis TaxID=1869 RepID=A0A0A6X1B8_ACTUT|nr:serine/threonine-protein kinase [Actinoplanes utahensis]KHD73887.1 serine/threonine protein kinase [Actinoplanes utahensis]
MGRTERNGHDGSLRLAGRYRLVEKLGTGGMSVVWRGYDEILGRDVAVKVLSPRLAEDRTFRDRLRQEALAAARLCHPHITGIHDFGEAPISEQLTVPYVVMELNDGESVSARLGRQGSLDWREAVLITAEIASALATAHARGLVHRDVTPANIMLTGSGAKIVDFGISAVVGQRDAAADGSLLGTPAYLAPERLGGACVLPATDVYALGLLLYRALTGRMPWPAESTAEALRAHLYAEPDPVPELDGMPPLVADLCLRCLAKSPADRPGAAEVARALAATVGVRPIIPPLRPEEKREMAAARAVASVPAPRGRPSSVLGLVRACLGRSAAGTVRLRAGLRIRSALRLGSVRPLGAGLFLGGRRRRSVPPELLISAARLRGGRDRKPAIAALATLTLLTATVLSWSARREAEDADQGRAAAAGPGVQAVAAGPDRIRCTVRYQVRRDSGADFEARLSVSTTETSGWRMEFSFPGTQRLSGTSGTITQHGRRVVVAGRGRARAVTLHGGYRQRNPLPLSFALNGSPCRAEVLGGTTDGSTLSPALPPALPPGLPPALPPSGDDSVNAATVEKPEAERPRPRKRQPSRGGAPRQHHPAPTATSADPEPTGKRPNGFSLAL